jgi:hypothetical protein
MLLGKREASLNVLVDFPFIWRHFFVFFVVHDYCILTGDVVFVFLMIVGYKLLPCNYL